MQVYVVVTDSQIENTTVSLFRTEQQAITTFNQIVEEYRTSLQGLDIKSRTTKDYAVFYDNNNHIATIYYEAKPVEQF